MKMATGRDVIDICGTDQLASDLKAGMEGVIQVLTDLYKESVKVGGASSW